jgi:hypothetical protein
MESVEKTDAKSWPFVNLVSAVIRIFAAGPVRIKLSSATLSGGLRRQKIRPESVGNPSLDLAVRRMKSCLVTL